MTQPSPNAEILDFAENHTLQNAKLDAITEIQTSAIHELVLEYRALVLAKPAEIKQKNDQLIEILNGHYIPYKLIFKNIRWLKREGLYQNLAEVAADDASRFLQGVLYWEKPVGRWGTPYREPLYIFFHNSWNAQLVVCTLETSLEKQSAIGQPITIERNWSSTPPIPPGIAYWKTDGQKKYGGDAIPIYLDGQQYADLLFVGGLENQYDYRPAVDVVLNLCEIKNRWLVADDMPATDRWSQQGEADIGMSLAQITTEAEWVIERLRAQKQVLVHCEMGFNRSVTICCAVLILLEKISAEDALLRIREHHRWARPDAYHWLKLRWLAEQQR